MAEDPTDSAHEYSFIYVQGQSSLNTPGMMTFTLKQPYGVVAAIIPWNVSMIMFAMKVAPALAGEFSDPSRAFVKASSSDVLQRAIVLSSSQVRRSLSG